MQRNLTLLINHLPSLPRSDCALENIGVNTDGKLIAIVTESGKRVIGEDMVKVEPLPSSLATVTSPAQSGVLLLRIGMSGIGAEADIASASRAGRSVENQEKDLAPGASRLDIK
jgi:hypothetical protein